MTLDDMLDVLWAPCDRCRYFHVPMEIVLPTYPWRMSWKRDDNSEGYMAQNGVRVRHRTMEPGESGPLVGFIA